MHRNTRIAVLATLAATLSACGGSKSSTGTGTPSSTVNVGAVSGSITGFGSVFVDGAEYDDTAATVSDDTDPAKPVASTLDALAIGQSVDLSLGNAGRINHIGIGATLAGPIDAGSIDPNDAGSSNMVADSFTLLGQTVTFVPSGAGATLFVGVTDSTQLKDGQQVLVHGPINASGVVTANLIVVLPSGSKPFYRVTGLAQSTDATAKTFKLGADHLLRHGQDSSPRGLSSRTG